MKQDRFRFLIVFGFFFPVLIATSDIFGQCVPAPPGLVGWWPGDGNANDISDGNAGVLVNGATFSTGKVGDAFSFDGLDDFVLIEDDDNLNPSSGITLDAWVLVTDDSGDVGDIISKDGEEFDRQYLLAVGIGTRKFRAHIGIEGVGLIFFDGATVFNLNQWYHVAMTYDGEFLRLYVDGLLDGSMSVSGSIISTTQPVRIGGGAPPGLQQIHFRGLIDEVEIFSRALSTEEILSIYWAGSAGKCKSLQVLIDIKPGSDNNRIKPCNNPNEVITVAILTTDDFDALTVDHATVSFEGAAEVHQNRRSAEPLRHEEDVDGDGDMDLVFHFRLGETDLTCVSTEGTLSGNGFDGTPIEGTDSVTMGMTGRPNVIIIP